jgi:hypothetical protein
MPTQYETKAMFAAISEIIKLSKELNKSYDELHESLERIANVDSTVVQPLEKK